MEMTSRVEMTVLSSQPSYIRVGRSVGLRLHPYKGRLMQMEMSFFVYKQSKHVKILVRQNYSLRLASFCLIWRMALSGLPGMFSSTILLEVKVWQEMLSSTIFLLGAEGTSLLLCAWDTCYPCLFFILSFGMVNRTLSHIFGRLYLPMFLLRVGLLTLM